MEEERERRRKSLWSPEEFESKLWGERTRHDRASSVLDRDQVETESITVPKRRPRTSQRILSGEAPPSTGIREIQERRDCSNESEGLPKPTQYARRVRIGIRCNFRNKPGRDGEVSSQDKE